MSAGPPNGYGRLTSSTGATVPPTSTPPAARTTVASSSRRAGGQTPSGGSRPRSRSARRRSRTFTPIVDDQNGLHGGSIVSEANPVGIRACPYLLEADEAVVKLFDELAAQPQASPTPTARRLAALQRSPMPAAGHPLTDREAAGGPSIRGIGYRSTWPLEQSPPNSRSVRRSGTLNTHPGTLARWIFVFRPKSMSLRTTKNIRGSRSQPSPFVRRLLLLVSSSSVRTQPRRLA